MRIQISGIGKVKLPAWREKARKNLHFLGSNIARAIRQCVAERMEAEAMKRAFKAMGQRSKTEFRKQQRAYEDAKYDATLAEMEDALDEGEIDISEVVEASQRMTLAVAGNKAKEKRRSEYKAVAWKTKVIGGERRRVVTHYRLLGKKGRKVVPVGKRIPAANVKRSVANLAYWARLRALAEALQLTKKDGRLDLLRSRKIDRKMMNVPDSVRRKIYDECVEKNAAGYIGPSHFRGTELIPTSRKELRQWWGNVGDGHGNRKGKGRPRHRGGSRGRR